MSFLDIEISFIEFWLCFLSSSWTYLAIICHPTLRLLPGSTQRRMLLSLQLYLGHASAWKEALILFPGGWGKAEPVSCRRVASTGACHDSYYWTECLWEYYLLGEPWGWGWFLLTWVLKFSHIYWQMNCCPEVSKYFEMGNTGTAGVCRSSFSTSASSMHVGSRRPGLVVN